MLEELKSGFKVVGAKQTKRAITEGRALRVYLASDAGARVIEPLEALCAERSVPVDREHTMAELGAACGIAVGSAAVAVLR